MKKLLLIATAGISIITANAAYCGSEHPATETHLTIDNQQLMQDIRSIAQAAGELLIEYRNSNELNMTKVAQSNGQIIYQTKANLLASEFICNQLAEKYPDYGLLSHDHMERDPDWYLKDRVWIIQAVDGTRAYAGNSDEFHVQIGLLEGNDPKLGISYYPAKNMYVWAEDNKGAWIEKDGKKAQLTLQPSQGKRLIQSSSHAVIYPLLQKSGWEADELIEACSNSTTRLLKMIQGEATLYISLGSQGKKIRGTICNYGANAVIAKETGLSLTTLNGTSLNFRKPNGLLSEGVVLSSELPPKIEFFKHDVYKTSC